MARLVSERADVIAALAEVFRTHGYEGATLARIELATGLGKGSLYHFFPGGKAEMAAAVLAEINRWFDTAIFAPLRGCDGLPRAIAQMLAAVDGYFRSGQRICLIGAFALNDTRDSFAAEIAGFFIAWTAALAGALRRAGLSEAEADARAEDAVAAIQGALVSARAQNDPAVFGRILRRTGARLLAETG